jgi:hypothetical protein
MNFHKWDGSVPKQIEFVLEWTATALLIAGVALTSWNIYPLNLYISLAGNFAWLLVALLWKKWSLITIEFVIILIYIAGVVKLLT